jgi:hypothetical protein
MLVVHDDEESPAEFQYSGIKEYLPVRRNIPPVSFPLRPSTIWKK